eukprot:CAMPEP_0171316440 /NCGR_PEP_ID=MMETSP0816-20121228/72829_1 /TAXON_ID=420281 /ORGANISM="Proboscia inermis, Strain CCAP1064/1" /LENGTH=69 /DNA_ID=CAMNT_0011808449 /DNA_START=45 /DNA_END=254 /DNA_ORIENTATION=-
MGFTREGLLGGKQNNAKPTAGLVGKTEWEDEESRLVDLPDYLHDFKLLFPVPQTTKKGDKKKKQKKKKK